MLDFELRESIIILKKIYVSKIGHKKNHNNVNVADDVIYLCLREMSFFMVLEWTLSTLTQDSSRLIFDVIWHITNMISINICVLDTIPILNNFSQIKLSILTEKVKW